MFPDVRRLCPVSFIVKPVLETLNINIRPVLETILRVRISTAELLQSSTELLQSAIDFIQSVCGAETSLQWLLAPDFYWRWTGRGRSLQTWWWRRGRRNILRGA